MPEKRMVGESSRHNKRRSLSRQQNLVPQDIPLKYLKRITNDFCEERLLGEGGFGNVYKGVLENGRMIAVKQIKPMLPAIKQFENEVQILMKLDHKHVVRVVGFCSETEYIVEEYDGKCVWAEKSEKLLCLEYLPNGNLRSHLSDEYSGLGWDTRYKIIEGICYGLHYLHVECQVTTVIHMDLKPENILLDDNMVPKIADFGLARLFGEEQTRTWTINCLGTMGYMAPEYLMKGMVTQKLDIFGLGVTIIEIVTGKRHYPDEGVTSSQNFIERVLKNWRHRLKNTQGFRSQEIECQIRTCVQIGLECVKHDWEKRPTTPQIIKMLHGEGQSVRLCHNHPANQQARVEPNQENATANGSKMNIRLRFLSNLTPYIYVETKLTDGNNKAMKVAMYEGENIVTFGSLSEVKVQIVLLHDDFSSTCPENWTEEEFDRHIAQGPDGNDLVLGHVWLTDGEAELSHIRFEEGSHGRKYIMGARTCRSKKTSVRVQEAITKPVMVLDSRNHQNEKWQLPKLDDGVCLSLIERSAAKDFGICRRIEDIARSGDCQVYWNSPSSASKSEACQEQVESTLETFQGKAKCQRHELRQLESLCSNHHAADQHIRLETSLENANGSNKKYRLRFLNAMNIYESDEDGVRTRLNSSTLKIGIYDENNNIVSSGSLSKVNIEIIVLHGDFNKNNREVWTEENFDKYITGLRVRKNEVKAGEQTNEQNEKRHHSLDDYMYSLMKFTRNGLYRKRLHAAGSGKGILQMKRDCDLEMKMQRNHTRVKNTGNVFLEAGRRTARGFREKKRTPRG